MMHRLTLLNCWSLQSCFSKPQMAKKKWCPRWIWARNIRYAIWASYVNRWTKANASKWTRKGRTVFAWPQCERPVVVRASALSISIAIVVRTYPVRSCLSHRKFLLGTSCPMQGRIPYAEYTQIPSKSQIVHTNESLPQILLYASNLLSYSK